MRITIIILTILGLLSVLLITSCQDDGDLNRTILKNRQTVERYYRATNEGDTAALTELVSPRYTRKAGGIDDLEGLGPLKKYNYSLINDNKEFRFDIQKLVAGQNDAAVLWEASAVSQQDLSATWSGSSFITFDRNGKIQMEQLVSDRLLLMQQLGYELTRKERRQEEEKEN